MQELLLVRHDHLHPDHVRLYFPSYDFQRFDVLRSDCLVPDFLHHDCYFDDFAVQHFCAVNFIQLDDFQLVAVALLVVRLVAGFVADLVAVGFGIVQDSAHGKIHHAHLDMLNSLPTA